MKDRIIIEKVQWPPKILKNNSTVTTPRSLSILVNLKFLFFPSLFVRWDQRLPFDCCINLHAHEQITGSCAEGMTATMLLCVLKFPRIMWQNIRNKHLEWYFYMHNPTRHPNVYILVTGHTNSFKTYYGQL